MTQEEFIRAATRSGYCRMKTAREYADGRENRSRWSMCRSAGMEAVDNESPLL